MANLLDVATKSPGVYVFEEPSAVKAIGGVSTSTAGFIGVFSRTFQSTGPQTFTVTTAGKTVPLDDSHVDPQTGVAVLVTRQLLPSEYTVSEDGKTVTLTADPPPDAKYALSYKVNKTDKAEPELAPTDKVFTLSDKADKNSVKVMESTTKIADIDNDTGQKKGRVTFGTPLPQGATFTVSYQVQAPQQDPGSTPSAPEGVAILFTNFTEFKKEFGDFDGFAKPANYLRHAVFGFFNNGGSRCYVIWVSGVTKNIDDALNEFAAIDEIALVVAPGATSAYSKLSDHCKDGTLYRFAILDGPQKGDVSSPTTLGMPGNTDYAAFYYPWIKVFDPNKVEDPKEPRKKGGLLDVPPSGHLAGIYARVDSLRGVHKAPANEPIRGALGVTHPLSKAQQDGLNVKGVNCIRFLNNNFLVWGARTVGGDENQDLKYINVRRTLLFLRKSIDQGTQWVVFEPNTRALWKKITRNVDAFLTEVWRSGALFGDTPQEAFYVRCDDEINPASRRELGLVVTEIGVAIARPAEFVVFQISQFTAPA
ncbi:MAG: phage tail sheath family protein [Gammaproteobacteria bacterium]